MAIGEENTSFGGNSERKSNREYAYYPRLKFKREETAINYEFQGGLLKFKIVKKNSDNFSYDTEHPLAAISLSPTKAVLLTEQIKLFRNYIVTEKKIDPNKAWGVNGGMGEKISYIAFHATTDKHIIVDIGKFDNNGRVIESASHELNFEYHYALEWNNLKEMDITRVFNNMIELNQILATVEDFGRYMNGALAYSVADTTRYDLGRVLGKLDPVYDKLGIERVNNGSNYKPRGNNNFLSNTGTSQSKSYDSIQDMLE